MRLSLLPVITLGFVLIGFAETQQRSLKNNDAPNEPELGRFGVLRLDALATDAAGDVCYMLRTYKVEREEKDSDATRIVGQYKCQHASRFNMKKAKSRELPAPSGEF